ncbi:unnamed protein product [Schistosoma margrebowiei]|uniref:Transmembrane protein n=1 Tax=Schistosoma margrebowiei TaxID=48269 RepID=A0A3P8BBD3_9TREM|nr:unnamed protein product [Schistosoma margrebowiei]
MITSDSSLTLTVLIETGTVEMVGFVVLFMTIDLSVSFVCCGVVRKRDKLLGCAPRMWILL